jgi:hypothetical protein
MRLCCLSTQQQSDGASCAICTATHWIAAGCFRTASRNSLMQFLHLPRWSYICLRYAGRTMLRKANLHAEWMCRGFVLARSRFLVLKSAVLSCVLRVCCVIIDGTRIYFCHQVLLVKFLHFSMHNLKHAQM